VVSAPVISSPKQFWPNAALLWSLVSEMRETSSQALKEGKVVRGCGLRLCNLLFEVQENSFGLNAVILSCLVSALWKTGIELRIILRSFDLSKMFRTERNKYARFGAKWYVHFRITSAHTHTHTYDFKFIYKI
jgi:hypothetical protein